MLRLIAQLRNKKLFNVLPVALETYQIMRYEGGLDHLSACAWVGNEEAEDSFDNTKTGDRDASGVPQAHGPAQHHQARIDIIKQPPPKGCGIDIITASHADQIRAIIWEATKAPGYSHVMERVKSATTMREKIEVIVREYEKSKAQDRDIGRRTQYGLYWAEKIPPHIGGDPQ